MSEGHTERLDSALDGKYHIERKLGEGGMASVYLAEDIKHKRKVALKILRPELAVVIGAERFLTEITTTANLQHPHILPLFDSGAADGYPYVMPFIDGETLGGKLEREKQLGVDEAVRIARDVADALDYAHRNGVIHRDIKPANILLHDGRPVVADFGIALAISAAGGGRMTETGLSLGTPHYMSPEQASADRDLSARSDIYSLGCVLYEMIAGQPPHTGPSAQSILVRILTESPKPLTELRHTVPPHISAVVAKSIEKLPADRFDSAKAFMDALDDSSFTYTASPDTRPGPAAAPAPTTNARSTGVPAWVAAAVAVFTLGAGYVLANALSAPIARAPSAEFLILPDSSHRIVSPCCGRTVAVSPQGDRVVYQGQTQAGQFLYQRPLGQREAQVLVGTEGGRHPFFSPDGEWLGFFNDTGLMKVRFDGGSPLPVTPLESANAGGSWGPNNRIVFGQRATPGLFMVSTDGGIPERITTVDTTAGEREHAWPDMMPDGETVLFGMSQSLEGPTVWSIEALRIETGERSEVMVNAGDPRFVEPGFLVFSDGVSSIMAQPFDANTLELSGDRFRVADNAFWREGLSEYDISRTGTLVIHELANGGGANELVLVDRTGQVEVVPVSGGSPQTPRFSPDGRYIAYTLASRTGLFDIGVWDLDRSNPNRVTFEGRNSFPAWTPDGARVLFHRLTDGGNFGATKSRDGSGQVEQVIENVGRTASFSRDGRWLVWTVPGGPGGIGIWYKSTDGEVAEAPLLGSAFEEFSPAISPDGRWIAYVSQDDGDDQVYVQPFPDLGPRFKVSLHGGRSPVWSPDGSELFFRDYSRAASWR